MTFDRLTVIAAAGLNAWCRSGSTAYHWARIDVGSREAWKRVARWVEAEVLQGAKEGDFLSILALVAWNADLDGLELRLYDRLQHEIATWWRLHPECQEPWKRAIKGMVSALGGVRGEELHG